MTELDKAQAVVVDKNNSFAKLKEVSGVSIPTLKTYRADPDKLRTARWITVHKLASMYNKEDLAMQTTSKTEQKLYDALLKWVEVADSTPSDPEQGVVLTYRADNGTLSFWKDFYEDDFQNLSFEDIVEAEEAIGYDAIAKALLNDVKSDADYNEENVKEFIEYLEN